MNHDDTFWYQHVLIWRVMPWDVTSCSRVLLHPTVKDNVSFYVISVCRKLRNRKGSSSVPCSRAFQQCWWTLEMKYDSGIHSAAFWVQSAMCVQWCKPVFIIVCVCVCYPEVLLLCCWLALGQSQRALSVVQPLLHRLLIRHKLLPLDVAILPTPWCAHTKQIVIKICGQDESISMQLFPTHCCLQLRAAVRKLDNYKAEDNVRRALKRQKGTVEAYMITCDK